MKNLTNGFLLSVAAGCMLIFSCSDTKNELIEVSEGNNSKTNIAKTSAVVYHIPNNLGVTDHANANTPNSIAWYLATYGGGTPTAPHIYYLSSNLPYYNIKSKLIIPANATLSESATQAIISCDANWTTIGTGEAITLGSNARLENLQLNANWAALYGVYSANTTKATIKNCIIQQTKKATGSACVIFQNCTEARLEGSMLRRAGADSDETGFDRKHCYLLTITNGNGIHVYNNDMAVSASGGIGISKAINVFISGNKIQDTGRSAMPGAIADGITCYHNEMGTTDRNIWILENTIWKSRNHGIHVSGYGFHIKRNRIYDSGLYNGGCNISVADHKSPMDCSGNIEIIDNILSNCPAFNGKSINRDHYTSPFVISGNTICNQVTSGSTCN
ncbi:MAG: hypothetical protein EOO88_22170 [Pedobacter sp.]|nr:MAG: hypothetical protein EOO88_22170 [Pedobacter sp.]